jgi:hypothetical protein
MSVRSAEAIDKVWRVGDEESAVASALAAVDLRFYCLIVAGVVVRAAAPAGTGEDQVAESRAKKVDRWGAHKRPQAVYCKYLP